MIKNLCYVCFFIFILINISVIAQSREIAFTIDDLPVVSRIQDEAVLLSITDSLLKHLNTYKIPAAGFVIKSKVTNDDSLSRFKTGLLRRWLDAGMELGNHTYSHPSLNQTSAEEYIADIDKGEEIFEKVKPGYKPSLFRHPYLHTGRDSITRSAVEYHLHLSGYTIAPVSIDNGDYIFARAYEKAIMKNDMPLSNRIAADYINYMDSVVQYYENQSKALLGYEIKQILLMHANKLNSDCLDELAERLKSRGYKFISIREALTDPAYKLSDKYYGKGGISWLHRWALTQGRKGEYFKGEPEVPEYVNELMKD